MSNEVMKDENALNVSVDCDVLVVGAGIGGVTAAIAAARNGADVVLLEREYALGGLATLGLITIYLPLCDGKGKQVSFGIAEELLRLSIKYGAEKNYPKAWLENGTEEERKAKRFITQFNPNLFALEMEKVLLDLNVRIVYGSLATGVVKKDDKIDKVVIENKSGRSAIRVKNVVDASGDSDICKFADAGTALYQPKNGLASWYYYYSKGKVQLKMFGLADVLPDRDGQNTDNETVESIGNKRYTGVDGLELSEMVIQAHQNMYDDILKHKKEDPDYWPVSISSIPLLRMTRRLVGNYTLHDQEMHTPFEDSIGLISDWRKKGPIYEVPYRCLVGPKIKNLLVAGRNVSVTDDMWDITRVIPACAVTGQAAGTAAAMFDEPSNGNVGKLQEKLKQDQVVLHLEELE